MDGRTPAWLFMLLLVVMVDPSILHSESCSLQYFDSTPHTLSLHGTWKRVSHIFRQSIVVHESTPNLNSSPLARNEQSRTPKYPKLCKRELHCVSPMRRTI